MFKQNIILIFALLFGLGVHAQNQINQFDDQGKRHGVWKKYFENSKQLRYEGTFEHGKEVGVFTFYKKVGKISRVAATKEFNANDNIAKVTFYTIGKKVISRGNMDGKKYVGEWTYYHKNSDVVMTKEFYDADGRLDGKKLIYYPSSQLAQETNFVQGSREGAELFYAENGTVVKSYNYRNDQLHGEAKHYNEHGDLILEGQYKNDKKTGVWKWYANGEIIKEKDYTYIPKFKKKQ